MGSVASAPRATLAWPALGGALGSALLLTLAEPPFSLFPLSFLALVPLSLGLGSLPPSPHGRWQATLLGLIFGVAFWGFALVWIPLEVAPYFPWAYPGYALMVLLLGGLSALFGWLTLVLHRGKGLPLGLALPLSWVGVEWIKAHFPFGLAFPWLGLGVTLSDWPQLLGLAEWTGEAGVAFWVAGVNGLFAGGILGMKPRRVVSPWVLLIGVVGLPSALSVARDRTLPLHEGPRVVVVGTQLPRGLRRTPGVAASEAMVQLREALRLVDPGGVDLVVLPEATIPFPMDSEDALGAREALAALTWELECIRWSSAPLAGVVRSPGRGRSPTPRTFSPPGTPGSRGTTRSDWFPEWKLGCTRKGPAPGPSGWETGSPGPSCATSPSLASWLGEPEKREPDSCSISAAISGLDVRMPCIGSFFLHQHPAHLVLRAVENRVSIARAANGGFSFLLDPRGRVLSETVPPTGGATGARVPVHPRLTLFTRTGDWVGPGAAILCLFLVLAQAGTAKRTGFLGPSADR